MITICHTPEELKIRVREAKKAGKTIGLVPTMGALHEGHASLIRASHKKNEVTIVSIFLNPTQFGPTEDLDAYPRSLDADCRLCEVCGAQIVFAPQPRDMYPGEEMTWVEVTGMITKVLCGRTRPIHFRGVTTVVMKLFQLAQPDRAYFGQKDAQQVQVLKRMVRDLFVPVEIRVMPIVREPDGLAKSSRNAYLSPAQRKSALVLSRALRRAEEQFEAGERRSSELIGTVQQIIGSEPGASVEYVEMHRLPDLDDPEETITGPHLLAVAVKFGTTRLIDNVILGGN